VTRSTPSNFIFGKERAFLQARRVQARIPAGIDTKKGLIDALDAGLGFPDYFGGNWDAFEECIRDLSWLDPIQVVLTHEDLPMHGDRESLKTYLSILDHAVARWKAKPEHELVVVFPAECEATVRELMAEE
jgi:hypothetical protein